jgi:multidrug efflux pump subunit AcrA (membrane-fusion protein)
MLRAFNGESDAAVAKVKFNNVTVMEARIRKAYEKINGLAEVQKCLISQSYLSLKLQELFLAHEYQEKLQEEREEQRHIREQIREEEIAQRQLEKARLEAEREETRYDQALARAREEVERAEGANREKLSAQIAELQQRLAEARAAKERAISQAQLTRSGNVYIISNIGSFGEDVFKIGMTRRLDPYDRVHELSGAAVPFDFDVHAMIRSEDAPALENKLHRMFHLRRLNRINERREFFRVTLDEILLATGLPVADIEVTRIAEAEDYRKTLALLEEESKRTPVISRTATTTSSGDIGAQLQSPLVAISPTATSAAPYSSSPELAGHREGGT